MRRVTLGYTAPLTACLSANETGATMRRQRVNAKTLFDWRGASARYNEWAAIVSRTNHVHHPKFVFEDGQTIEVSKRSNPPGIVDGVMRAWVSKQSKDPSGHCEWSVRHEDLISKTYLHLGKTYRWEIEMRLATLDRAMKYQNSHICWWQIWGPMNVGNPSTAMMIYRGKWRVQSYGGNPERDKRADHCLQWGTPDDRWHRWEIELLPHPTDGLLCVQMDGMEVHGVSGPTAYADALRTTWGGQNRFGCYTPPTEEECVVEFRKVRFDVLG